MKLAPEHITLIEQALTDYEDGLGGRGIIIKYGFPDLGAWSGFCRCVRVLGVPLHWPAMKGLSTEDRKAFVEFLREKRRAKEQTSGPSNDPRAQ